MGLPVAEFDASPFDEIERLHGNMLKLIQQRKQDLAYADEYLKSNFLLFLLVGFWTNFLYRYRGIPSSIHQQIKRIFSSTQHYQRIFRDSPR